MTQYQKSMLLKNSKGKIYYGMHFYPGVAEYSEPGKDPYRVFLSESTLRSMDPSFAGRPVFVNHVDEVEGNIDDLRGEADGWVVESFFNQADGKHWVKFIVVSERAEKAIQRGFRLSNAYVPSSFCDGGFWNGVTYAREITSGEFDHLAIVPNPRYEASVILTPEQFKQHNEQQLGELKRLSNSKDKQGESEMSFKLFKKTKVENSTDITGMSVVLPKSGKEVTIEKLVNDADQMAVDMNAGLADMSHKVKMEDGSCMNVGDLLAKHKAMNAELEELKKKKEDASDEEVEEVEEGEKDLGDHGGDKSVENEEDESKKKAEADAKEKEESESKKKNEADKTAADKAAADKKAAAKAKADALKNAHNRASAEEAEPIEFSGDMVARGKSLYGSN